MYTGAGYSINRRFSHIYRLTLYLVFSQITQQQKMTQMLSNMQINTTVKDIFTSVYKLET